jgi:hypothetical protein
LQNIKEERESRDSEKEIQREKKRKKSNLRER